MPKMIQIRHVPDTLHKQLRIRAAEAGMTLSDFLRATLEREASKMTTAEIRARLAALEPVESDVSTVDEIRAMREERDAELDDRTGRIGRR